MNLIIYRWSGRLGNNIIQVKHAIQVALAYNYNVCVPLHKFFTTDYIIVNPDVKKTDPVFTISDFYFRHDVTDVDPIVFTQNIEKTIELLRSVFRFQEVTPLNNDDLLIHIRGGDIFNTDSTAHNYIMPPLSYYKEILDTHTYANVRIIAEDKANPCISALLRMYPNIQYTQQSLEEDVLLILGSATVVESFGTFSDSLLLLSRFIKKVYKPSYQFDVLSETFPNLEICKKDLEEYRLSMNPWKNTEEQRRRMLTFTPTS